ncbi:MAG: nicotinate-nucleotide--dimethylbenzimidazole phosphoribosyltransferase [Methylomonas sp.]|jgi:nicotinate-nucleotide--dimethylbenzimidazole phosphoribosyltransferase|uniref:nicotinate-nucleotide--dimethylbenzimidazole phosphoribosyltransferase n=1 Tax=Methylomonas sp. TaxID=418 RepID=UPI0025E465E3|nr:nicotinate-nucleotide--dimethylbenzimidazole phosphoribosyltransferase [Methylomonas sp.]MCK9605543.1 nicotinate-nucleotide--dimethylbenzimidazole phosphoribosyltransferase [Methylomonas sp.]
MQTLFLPIAAPDAEFYRRALHRQTQLTKPPGSLGRLEQLAVALAALQRRDQPALDNIHISIFAADHGIAAEAVSAFPQAVTAEMVKNFAAGGAAVNVLARQLNAHFEVVDVGLLNPVELPSVIRQRAGAGTENFKIKPAMSEAQLQIALAAGRAAVSRALVGKADIFIGGEMGIANTCSASAMAAALLAVPADEITGAGTGLNAGQIRHKAAVIQLALQTHCQRLTTPLAVLQTLGGFEIAALAAAYISAAQQRLPVLVDGFISSVAALLAARINPDCRCWFFYGHRSEEKGHQQVLDALAAEPILQLGMRLGEASGAVMAVPVLQMACRLHNEMATFSQARISAGL